MLGSEAAAESTRRAEAAEREAALESSETAIRSRIETLSAQLAALRPDLAAALEAEAAARERLEGARERLAAVEREGLALAEHEEVARRKRTEWEREAGLLASRQETARREAEEARSRRDGNVRERDAAARVSESVSIESENRSVGAAEAEDAVRRVRAIFDDARQKRFDAEILASRITSDLGHAVEATSKEFGVSPEALPPDPGIDAESRLALEAEALELADQIEKMGPVNVLAFEEYREQSERLTFLTAQKADLEASIASLMETIRKINATSSERFAEAFAQINAHFSALFQRLFRGGTAQMRLLDENDVLDSGIEITAQPPGKRNQSILLLSGGEKAMTAIALLMGIFKYKPSPFCILDEVDAPLDDANIDRFAQLIREMSEETQFIAITHNKRTMEGADALYGVTMEEAGCSKIVSVRFD
jgi:chromosome segregation protein